MPCSLDGDGQFSLMPGTTAGHTLWQDLASFRNELAQLGNIFEIDMFDFVGTKSAHLAHQNAQGV